MSIAELVLVTSLTIGMVHLIGIWLTCAFWFMVVLLWGQYE